MDRAGAVERVEEFVETVESTTMPVPIREIWVYGDVALGLDPVERLDIYVTKDILLGDESTTDTTESGDTDEPGGTELDALENVDGIGSVVKASWATEFPDHVRTRQNGYVAPERCLAAQLLEEGEPIHLEVCNASFDDNVTQRLAGAQARDAYEELLDPRGVCLWIDGQRSEDAFEKLREGDLVFPTLAGALEMMGMEDPEATDAADQLKAYQESRSGTSVRGDVV